MAAFQALRRKEMEALTKLQGHSSGTLIGKDLLIIEICISLCIRRQQFFRVVTRLHRSLPDVEAG